MVISFIVPIYKVEQYLEQCISSILNQTYRNIEVILVDDGSPDGCPAICDAYAKQDNRVKVIHKPNGGLSDARNAGLCKSTGDYVVFVDSDDFWANDTDLEQLVFEAEKTPECDFIGFNCSYYYDADDTIIPWVKYDDEILESLPPFKCIDKLVVSGTFPMSACLKLIKRECIQGKIKFIKGMYCEDIPWFIELLKNSNRCRFVNKYIYMYRKGVATSISSSFSYKKYSDLFKILKDGVEINKIEPNETARDALFSFWAYELCILRAMTSFMDHEQKNKELKELYEYNWLFNYQLHPKVKKVAFVQKLLGKKITNFILHKYLKTRLG